MSSPVPTALNSAVICGKNAERTWRIDLIGGQRFEPRGLDGGRLAQRDGFGLRRDPARGRLLGRRGGGWRWGGGDGGERAEEEEEKAFHENGLEFAPVGFERGRGRAQAWARAVR